jgi:hypothetical protein
VWWIVAGVVCWSGAVVAMLQAVTSTDARCLTSLTSLAYGTDVHGLALPLQVVNELALHTLEQVKRNHCGRLMLLMIVNPSMCLTPLCVIRK